MDLKLLPRPKQLDMASGSFAVPGAPVIKLSKSAQALVKIIEAEWEAETSGKVSVAIMAEEGFCFAIGDGGTAGAVEKQPEAYCLEITPKGVIAHADSYVGLVYAWQTLKQILRHNIEELPCLKVSDWPDLRWRIYHVDLKATRRRLSNLYDILGQLSELKVNAVLVEYEDYIHLERHPELAVADAPTKDQLKAWVAAAADYGVAVVPLVQTLAHWQYILGREEFAHLQEEPGDTTTACPSQALTWTLASDFLDEMMEIHPDAPFIHVGLDETLHLGKCPACKEKLNGRPPIAMFTDWANRICSYVLEHGHKPMMWADMIESLDPSMGQCLNRETTYVDWGYMHSGPAHPYVNVHRKQYISKQWLQRPEGEINGIRCLNLMNLPDFYEDLPEDKRAALKAYLDNPEYPKKLRTDIRLAWLRELGLKRGAVTGIRVSYHGCIAPLFIHGQLNTLTWAQSCKELGAEVIIGSSWARGHSFAGANAHPELDWYGIATLGDSAWGSLQPDELRAFDERFAFQFFGLDDGHIGDLYYLFQKSNPRAHDVMDSFFGYISEDCQRMIAKAKRNKDRLTLLGELAALQVHRLKAQSLLLEMEYFYANLHAMPAKFKQRIVTEVAATETELTQRAAGMENIYKQTLIDADAKELAAAQVNFWKDIMVAMKKVTFGD